MKHFSSKISQLLNNILNFIFPSSCLKCNQEGKLICKKCLDKIENNLNSSFSTTQIKKVYVLANWDDELIQKIVHKLKFHFAKSLINDLEPFLKNTLNKINLTKNSILLPIPLHKIRQNERGFNQSKLLANKFSEIIKIPVKTKLIKRIRNSYPQSKLQGQERRNNLKNAFKTNQKHLNNISKNTNIFLVDDVASTLTTLN